MTLVEAAHERIARAQEELHSAKALLRIVDVPPMPAEARAAVDFVAERHGVTLADIVGPQRQARFSVPRALAMYLLRSIHGIPPQVIGVYLNRDRTTVEQALQTVHDRRDTEKKYRLELSALVTAYTPPQVTPKPHTDHVSETTTHPAGGTAPANARSNHP